MNSKCPGSPAKRLVNIWFRLHATQVDRIIKKILWAACYTYRCLQLRKKKYIYIYIYICIYIYIYILYSYNHVELEKRKRKKNSSYILGDLLDI
jgi:hypothetical protein